MSACLSFDSVKAQDKVVSDWLLRYPERVLMARKAASKGLAVKFDIRWLDLIDNVESCLTEEQRVFLEVRRQARSQSGRRQRGRPGWVPYTQSKYPLAMARRTGKDPALFYISTYCGLSSRWEKIVQITARLAIKRGLL